MNSRFFSLKVPCGYRDLAVDGVVIVAEHGDYVKDLKGRWLLPRWWIFEQVVAVFEQSKRSVKCVIF